MYGMRTTKAFVGVCVCVFFFRFRAMSDKVSLHTRKKSVVVTVLLPLGL